MVEVVEFVGTVRASVRAVDAAAMLEVVVVFGALVVSAILADSIVVVDRIQLAPHCTPVIKFVHVISVILLKINREIIKMDL